MPILKAKISLSEQSSINLDVGHENQTTRECCQNFSCFSFDYAYQENEGISKFEDISKFLVLDGIEKDEQSEVGQRLGYGRSNSLEEKSSECDMVNIEKGFLKKKSSQSPTILSETKNIPKNFGKQIIKFVRQNVVLIQNILFKIGSTITYDRLNEQLQNRKKKMNRIQNLRSLWVPNSPIGKEMRIISMLFLKKHCFHWIFGSRITQFSSHLKYRTVLQHVLASPEQFVYLKRQC